MQKKTFNIGFVIPAKRRQCKKCSEEKCCDGCKNRINGNKEFEAFLNSLKRKALNQFGHMLPYYE